MQPRRTCAPRAFPGKRPHVTTTQSALRHRCPAQPPDSTAVTGRRARMRPTLSAPGRSGDYRPQRWAGRRQRIASHRIASHRIDRIAPATRTTSAHMSRPPPSPRTRPPPSPRSPPSSDGLRSLESTADMGNDEPPAFEACYSIALHGAAPDRQEPSASIELFSPRSRVRKPPTALPPAYDISKSPNTNISATTATATATATGASASAIDSDMDNPKYCMTPRSAAAGFDLSKAFSLAQFDAGDGGDSIDELFGADAEQQDRWDLAVVGFLTALLVSLVSLVFVLLLPATGRKRTFYACGALVGAVLQGIVIAVVVLERKAV